jgi:hypothetical protein
MCSAMGMNAFLCSFGREYPRGRLCCTCICIGCTFSSFFSLAIVNLGGIGKTLVLVSQCMLGSVDRWHFRDTERFISGTS